ESEAQFSGTDGGRLCYWRGHDDFRRASVERCRLLLLTDCGDVGDARCANGRIRICTRRESHRTAHGTEHIRVDGALVAPQYTTLRWVHRSLRCGDGGDRNPGNSF